MPKVTTEGWRNWSEKKLLHHIYQGIQDLLLLCKPNSDAITKQDLQEMEKRIMATQAELAQQLRDVKAELDKVGAETDTLLTKIQELQDALNNQPNATQELTDAVAAVAAQAKVVDDKVPDAPVA